MLGRIKKIPIIIALAAICLVGIAEAGSASIAGEYRCSDELEREVNLYLIANHDEAGYHFLDNYRAVDIVMLSNDELGSYINELLMVIGEPNLSVVTQGGEYWFESLNDGLYLIEYGETVDGAAKSCSVSPALVSLPDATGQRQLYLRAKTISGKIEESKEKESRIPWINLPYTLDEIIKYVVSSIIIIIIVILLIIDIIKTKHKRDPNGKK